MLWDFTVTIDPDGTPVVLTNVVSVDVQSGRQAQLDNFTSARCTVVLRYPNGYVTPITPLTPGTAVYIESEQINGGFPWTVMSGYISDVSVQYGIPFANNVGPADFLTINIETELARVARSSGEDYVMSAGTVTAQLTAANTASVTNIGPSSVSYFNTISMSGTTVTGSWADWLNQMAFSVAGRIVENSTDVLLTSAQPVQEYTAPSFTFTDAGGTGLIYDELTFDTLAQNYFTQVTIDPTAVAAQTVESGSAPFRNLTLNTYSPTVGGATDLANYLLNNYDEPSLAISSIHVNMAAVNGNIRAIITNGALYCGILGVGNQINLVFRGVTYTCIIEGGALSATPGSCSLTLYVSGADLNAYLVLDNLVLGKLNENKLGF